MTDGFPASQVKRATDPPAVGPAAFAPHEALQI